MLKTVEVGMGVRPTAALFNHSCWPNTVRQKQVLRWERGIRVFTNMRNFGWSHICVLKIKKRSHMWIKYTKNGRMCETSAYATKSIHMFENGRISDYSRHFNFNLRPPKLIPHYSDFRICMETLPGKISFRRLTNRRTLGFTEKLHL